MACSKRPPSRRSLRHVCGWCDGAKLLIRVRIRDRQFSGIRDELSREMEGNTVQGAPACVFVEHLNVNFGSGDPRVLLVTRALNHERRS
jgi:hypothetical protein